jgi:subtilisin-like proprotein convertase family protein
VKNHSSDADWTLNAAGFHINHKYGFGRIDADAAVKSASSWQRVPEATDLSYGPETVNQSIPDNNPAGIVSAIHVDRDMKLEHAEVVLNATHRYRGSLKVVLTSPSGTQSILAESRSDRNADYDGWKFMTVRNWGEGSVGEWKLTVADTVLSNTGTFDSWELILHGTAEAVNHPPVLKSDTAETNKDTAVTVSVLANDSDADGDALTVTSLSNPAHGSVAANADNTVTYTPETGFAGEDRFTYSAKDKAVSSTADVTVLVGKVREIYSAEPQAPIPDGNATGLSSGIRINAAGLIKDVNVTLNIRHPSLADMEAALISPKGTRAVMVRNISGKDMTGTTLDDEARQALSEGSAPFQAAYRPSEILSSFAGEFLIGEWKLQVTDTAENTIEGILESWQLEVCYFPLWENYPPAAVNDAAATKKDTPVIIPVLDNDRDPNGDTLTVTDLSVLPARGSVKADSDSRLQYTPESGFTGTDSFVYIVSDGQGKTAAATVSVTVFALENVIPGLRVLSGQTPERTDGIADINNNHKLDMPDVIFILIKLSER